MNYINKKLKTIISAHRMRFLPFLTLAASSLLPTGHSFAEESLEKTPLVSSQEALDAKGTVHGRRGKRGHRGPHGHKGKRGHTGIDGFQGPPGPQGPAGITGPTGFAGAQGPEGPTPTEAWLYFYDTTNQDFAVSTPITFQSSSVQFAITSSGSPASQFTVQTSGTYLIDFGLITSSAAASAELCFINLNVNSLPVYTAALDNSSRNANISHFILLLNAGDVVSLTVAGSNPFRCHNAASGDISRYISIRKLN